MKPPKRKPAGRNPGPESTRGKHPGERESPASAEKTGEEPSPRTDERDERTPAQSAPITNQDEQGKITNTSDQDTPTPER